MRGIRVCVHVCRCLPVNLYVCLCRARKHTERVCSSTNMHTLTGYGYMNVFLENLDTGRRAEMVVLESFARTWGKRSQSNCVVQTLWYTHCLCTCMCNICIYVCIYVCMHSARIYTYYAGACVYLCVYVCVYTHIMRVHVYICVCTCLCMWQTYLHIYIYASYIYPCIDLSYICRSTNAHTHTHTHTITHTHTQAHTCTIYHFSKYDQYHNGATARASSAATFTTVFLPSLPCFCLEYSQHQTLNEKILSLFLLRLFLSFTHHVSLQLFSTWMYI